MVIDYFNKRISVFCYIMILMEDIWKLSDFEEYCDSLTNCLYKRRVV